MDTIRVDWDGVTNRLCLEKLVWCGLSEVTATDSATFDTYVQERNGTFFDWRGYGEDSSGEFVLVLCVVQIPDTANLVTEATAYRNSTLTDDAGPLFVELEAQLPDDYEYTVQEGARQWYLHELDDEDFPGSINWLPVVSINGLNQRGRSDVVIGIIDTGISLYENWDDSDDLSHGKARDCTSTNLRRRKWECASTPLATTSPYIPKYSSGRF